MFDKYEIQIGKVLDGSNLLRTIPLKTLKITREQFLILEIFANQVKDSELNTIYKINDCEFKVVPSFDF